MRSILIHGHIERPTRDDVAIQGATLMQFVGDLIAGEWAHFGEDEYW
jgi:hypothetical protein